LSSAGGRGEGLDRLERIRDCGDAVKKTRGRCWTHPRQELDDSKSSNAISRVLRPTQKCQDVLDMRGLQEFEAAEFHKGDITAGEFDFERSAVMGGPEQHRLCSEQNAPLTVLQNLVGYIARLIGLIADARSDQRFLVNRSSARSMIAFAAASIGCVDR